MLFVDVARIKVKGGRGGDGAVAFLREKYRPKGGPAGGDGGKGGDVIIEATARKETLYDFKYKRHFKAGDGKHGGGKKMKGADGENVIIYVPIGTVVKDALSGKVLCDLTEEAQRCIVARGGKGGRGNAHFATSTNQTPTYAERGEPGEEREIILELKLIADAGIIGMPNAGKSTLLSVLTSAKPKVADYPFTTLHPNLGVLEIDEERRVTLADIPGLIEGASEGVGLGHQFLRHIERTKFLVHLIDVSDFRQYDPLEAFDIVMKEMEKYGGDLIKKPKLVVGTKIDILSDKSLIDKLRNLFKERGYEFLAVSAVTGENMENLKEMLWKFKERFCKQ